MFRQTDIDLEYMDDYEKKALLGKHALPTMPTSLNRDLGIYGNECLAFRKSIYCLALAKYQIEVWK